jgi:predicted TPR repeat methyltransferase
LAKSPGKKAASDQRLASVYHAKSHGELTKLYDDWSETYDSDMQQVGYIYPAIMGGLAARYVTNPSDLILDAGAGTGLIGHVLSVLGYSNLVAMDMSEGMLAKARARGVYGQLVNAVLGKPLPFETGAISAVIAAGVFTEGHAPAAAFEELTRVLKPGGHLIFTSGIAVWKDMGFGEKLAELSQSHLTPVEATAAYQSMPYSGVEQGLSKRAHVYRRR